MAVPPVFADLPDQLVPGIVGALCRSGAPPAGLRLVCREWARLVPGLVEGLCVAAPGRPGWEEKFSGIVSFEMQGATGVAYPDTLVLCLPASVRSVRLTRVPVQGLELAGGAMVEELILDECPDLRRVSGPLDSLVTIDIRGSPNVPWEPFRGLEDVLTLCLNENYSPGVIADMRGLRALDVSECGCLPEDLEDKPCLDSLFLGDIMSTREELVFHLPSLGTFDAASCENYRVTGYMDGWLRFQLC